jgi:endonuclease III
MTVAQLKAVADRLERLEGMGPKTARVVREELARIEFL